MQVTAHPLPAATFQQEVGFPAAQIAEPMYRGDAGDGASAAGRHVPTGGGLPRTPLSFGAAQIAEPMYLGGLNA